METKVLKNHIKKKPEETPTARLQSLRLPRDLSLGGTKPKKFYAPNINVVRNKDKAKEVIKTLDRKRKERIKNEPRNRNNHRFVQSSGVFSDGVAEQRKSSLFSEKSHYRSDTDPAASMAVPTYKKSKWTVNKQQEDNILDELVSKDDDMVEEKMPLMPVMWKTIENKVPDVKVVVKKEHEINGDVPNGVKVDMATRVPYFHKATDEVDDYRLALLKLPDSLAGKGLSDDPNVKKIFDYPLNVMLEGKIGTLQIRRSGKMYMKIGCVNYLLESSDFFSSSEVVASFTEPAFGSDKPHFAILGNVEERFVLNPIWSYLLKS